MDLLVTNGDGTPPFGIGPTELFQNINNNNNSWVEIDLYPVLYSPNSSKKT